MNKAVISDPYLTGLFYFAKSYTGSALADASGQKVDGLIRKISLLADRDLVSAWESAKAAGFKGGQSPDCRDGCDHCCHQAVSASVPEVLRLADWLRINKSVEDLAEIKDLAREYRDAHEGTDEAQRRASRMTCPLLKHGSCSAYEARPLICRSFHSYDVSACIRFIAGEQDSIDAEENMLPKAVDLVSALRHGIRTATEARDLPAPVVLMGMALSTALETEDASTRWLAGENLFGAAEQP